MDMIFDIRAMQRLDTATIIGKEQSTLKVYLVGTLERWNDAKQAEERDRVKHSMKGGEKND